MDDQLISIIVPVYQVEKYLIQCINSLINQSYINLEIILVDDGSMDLCGRYCDGFLLADSRITVIHKANGGLSDARNAGMNISTGKYLGFVDSDDYIDVNMYKTMHSYLEQYKADYCACGIIVEEENTGNRTAHNSGFFIGSSEETLKRLYNESLFPVSCWCKLSKMNLWKKVRFPVGKNYEDAYTTYRIIDSAAKTIQIPDLLYIYRVRENSIMTNKQFSLKQIDEIKAWEENYNFVKKKYPRLKSIAMYYWIEHIAKVLGKFPGDLSISEKLVKLKLVGTIFIHMPAILIFRGARALINILQILGW